MNMHHFGRCGRSHVIPTVLTEPTVFQRTPSELQVVFPPTVPGPNTVTLANGAVVDVTQLGQVVSEFCLGFVPCGGCL